MQTAAQYQDIIALTSASNIKCGLVFVDFHKVFDQVDHDYLLETMTRMGSMRETSTIVKNIAMGMSAKVSVNGQLTKQIKIKRGIPRGCPLSVLLYVRSLEPLLRQLQDKLKGINVLATKYVVGTYADDVAIVVRNRKDVSTTDTVLKKYCAASGARANEIKNKFLTIKGLQDIRLKWAQQVTEHTAFGTVLTTLLLQMIAKNLRKVA